jgi:hypothetical protein
MRQYLLSIYQPESGTLPPAELAEIMHELDQLNQEIRAAGSWVFSGGLHPPSTATVLRPTPDGLLTTDGPFAEGKEVIGGVYVIAAADLDEALRWGGRLAGVIGLPIEVRPFQPGPGA